MRSIIQLTIITLSFWTGMYVFAGFESRINPSRVEQARDFLLNCVYFSTQFPENRKRLLTESFNAVVSAQDMRLPSGTELCGLYSRVFRKIRLFPKAFNDEGCSEKNPMLVLSHEMLHQVGLPNHKLPLRREYDPIYKVMLYCEIEARVVGKPYRWTNE